MNSLLLYSNQLPFADAEIKDLGGKINQVFSSSLFSASLPEGINPEQLQHSTDQIPDTLDPLSQLAAEAWMEQSLKLTSTASALAGQSWDAPGFRAPSAVHPGQRYEAASHKRYASGTPTSLYMVGSIAVGLVMVSGAEDHRFTRAQQRKILAEVAEGLEFLAAAEPRAQISFHYDVHAIEVDVKAGSTADYELAEAPWRNAALKKLGYEGSERGSAAFARALRAKKDTDWSFIAYFTLFPLHHFAYAINERVVMHYENDGWGPNEISRVFAHEACHIFGAADEYGDCSCRTRHGHLEIPNSNCRSCSSDFTPCLMEQNNLALCEATRLQIGWHESLFPAKHFTTPLQ